MVENFAYKCKLITTKNQKKILYNQLFIHNQTWNILLNQSNQQFIDNQSRNQLNEPSEYLTSVEQDNLVKDILRDRELTFNTKVTQQCRMSFNDELQKTIKTFKSGKKSDSGMLKFKYSSDMNNKSFSTTKEQYKIKNTNNSKYRILRLFNQSFKIRWTKDFLNTSKIKYTFKSITISVKNREFYISFNIEKTFKSNKIFHKVNGNISKLNNIQLKKLNSASIDINIDNIDLLLTKQYKHSKISLKDIKNDNLNKKYRKKLNRLQRKQSKRVIKAKKTKIKLGKNFRKDQNKINRIKTKNKNKKVYNLHKIVNSVIKELKDNNINHLVVEDLNVKNMTVKTSHENKIKLLEE